MRKVRVGHAANGGRRRGLHDRRLRRGCCGSTNGIILPRNRLRRLETRRRSAQRSKVVREVWTTRGHRRRPWTSHTVVPTDHVPVRPTRSPTTTARIQLHPGRFRGQIWFAIVYRRFRRDGLGRRWHRTSGRGRVPAAAISGGSGSSTKQGRFVRQQADGTSDE